MEQKKPSRRDVQAVAAVVSNAEAGAALERMRGRLDELTGNDFPVVACLLDLLAEHPVVVGDNTLAGAVGAIQGLFMRLWDDCEAVGSERVCSLTTD